MDQLQPDGSWKHTITVPKKKGKEGEVIIGTGNVPSGSGVGFFNVKIVPTPEPSSLSLLGLGIAGLLGVRGKAFCRRS